MPSKFENLIVYQKAFQLVVEIYRITKNFPSDERFGLTSQIRRAAVSIISNIAEGSMRLGHLEFRQFTNIARGSVGEVRCQLQLAVALNYTNLEITAKANGLLDEVGKMLTGLAKTLQNANAKH